MFSVRKSDIRQIFALIILISMYIEYRNLHSVIHERGAWHKKERNIIISLVVGLCKKGKRHLGRCVRLICIYLPSAHCSTINTINRPSYTTPSNTNSLNMWWKYNFKCVLILCQLFTSSVGWSSYNDIGHNLFDPLPFDDVHRLKFPNLPTQRRLFFSI